MRFKNYILETVDYSHMTRGKEISLDEVMKLIPQYSDGIKFLYRHGNSANIMTRSVKSLFDYEILDPKTSVPRKSANTLNYYTFIIDNSKKWSKYPKRSQSIICLTDNKNIMLDYNYWVIPKNGAKIGEAPKSDMWFSFDTDDTLDTLNESIKLLLNLPYIEDDVKTITDDNYFKIATRFNLYDFDSSLSEFKKATLSFDRWFKDQDELSLSELKKNFSYTFFFKNWKGEPLYNYLDKLLDPKKNGFKIKSITNLDNNREAWTDSKSLLIHYKNMNKVLYSGKI